MYYPARRRHPFTLLEILAVIAIIVILAGIVIGTAGLAQRKAAEAKARSEISKFEIAVQKYKRDHGYLPQPNGQITRSFLESLESPDGRRYLNLDELRFSNNNWRDPFGEAYRYQQPGEKNPESYDVWSLGNDNQENTTDDIGNFSVE